MTDHSDLVERLRAPLKPLPDGAYETSTEAPLTWQAADLIEQQANAIAELTADRDQLRVRCDNVSDDADAELKAAYASHAELMREIERLRSELNTPESRVNGN